MLHINKLKLKYQLKEMGVTIIQGKYIRKKDILKILSKKIYLPGEILEHHKKYTSMPIQDHVKKQILSYPQWVKTEISVKDIEPRHTIDYLVEKYYENISKPPAIIVVPLKNKTYVWEALDGAHRIEVARKKGLNKIEAFRPY